MNYVSLEDKMAVCNDGSQAGYYIEKGSDPEYFVLHLMGGGYCFDNASCESRYKGALALMSSKPWASTLDGTGILSSTPSENPYWHNATHVFAMYCSSDSFCGSKTPDKEGLRWYFHGHYIVSAIVEDLFKQHGLEKAKQVLFSGSSAGAEGLLPNADRVASLIPNAKVTVFLDSGWFMDYEPYKQGSCSGLGDCTEYEAMKRAFLIWNPVVNKKCAAAKPSAFQYECMLGPHAYPFIETDTFVFQFRFDAAQMGHDGIYKSPSSGPELAYAQQAAKNLTETYHEYGAKAVFSPSCYHHTILRSSEWTKLSINGKTLPEVFNDWRTGKETKPMYIDTCNTPDCNPTCPK